MNLGKITGLLLGIVLALPGAALAQTCQSASIRASTPTARFTDNGDGTVSDTVTGLTWKRCAEGQIWDGASCSGSATALTWQAALQAGAASTFAGHSDWRLPNIKELGSIVERQCADPAINLSVFPGTTASGFWSGSPYAGNSDYACYVNFYYGFGTVGYTVSNYDVRLVRGGQSLISQPPSPPGGWSEVIP